MEPTSNPGGTRRRVPLVAAIILAVGAFILGRWSVPGSVPQADRRGPGAQARRFAPGATTPPGAAAAEGLPSPPPRTPQLETAAAFLKKYSNDPASFELVDWRPPVAYLRPDGDPPTEEVIHLTVRSRNTLGASVVGPALVYLNRGLVVEVLDLSDPGFDKQVSLHYDQSPRAAPPGGSR